MEERKVTEKATSPDVDSASSSYSPGAFSAPKMVGNRVSVTI
jgi:hypothetical protein